MAYSWLTLDTSPQKKLMYIFNHIHLSSPRFRRTCIGTFGRCFLLLLGLLQTFGDHSVQAVFVGQLQKVTLKRLEKHKKSKAICQYAKFQCVCVCLILLSFQ